jgi:hypothetical protein
LYPLFFLLIAYSLAVGNAGTGFRYRSQLVMLVIAAMVVLRERWLAAGAPARARLRGRSSPRPIPATVAARLMGARSIES